MQILNGGRRERVISLVFSHCGRWLAAGNTSGLSLWDTSNPSAKAKQLEVRGFWYSHNLAFRPDGQLFYGTDGGECFLIDPMKVEPRSLGRIDERIALSPDGSRLIRAAYPSPLTSWTFGADDKLVQGSRCETEGRVSCAAFSRDGSVLATIEPAPSAPPDPFLVFRSPETLQKICATKIRGHVWQLLFSPDGTKLIVPQGAKLNCYDVAAPDKRMRTGKKLNRKRFFWTTVHPEGKLLTVDDERLVRVWDINTMSEVRTLEWNIGKLYAVAVSPDGTRAAVGSHTGKVLVWDWD